LHRASSRSTQTRFQFSVTLSEYEEVVNAKECPELPHYHVVYEQVGSMKRPTKMIVSATPEEAIGVSVFDDTNGHEDEMPLLHQYVS
jgi:hypothetical protein